MTPLNCLFGQMLHFKLVFIFYFIFFILGLQPAVQQTSETGGLFLAFSTLTCDFKNVNITGEKIIIDEFKFLI